MKNLWAMGVAVSALAMVTATTVTSTVQAQSMKDDANVAARIRAVDAWLANQFEYEMIPGASAAIVHDQEILWSKGYGVASLETGAAVTPQTKFSICSISKLFTSIGVMQLRDQGKLNLDAPLKNYVKWFDLKNPHNEQVSLRGILSHVAGLPREAGTSYWTDVDFPPVDVIDEKLDEQEMLYRPYLYHQYSNLGMSLAGEAIASASRQSYDAYINKNILNPLGMRNTSTDLPIKEYGEGFAVGYGVRGKGGAREALAPYTINGISAAAGYASSAEDLAKFASWQFRLLENNGNEVLQAATLREMQRVHWMAPDWDGPAWGLGFAMRRHDGKTLVGHGGYCPGYRSEFVTRPQDKIGVVVMVNVNDMSPGALALDIYDLVAGSITAAAKAKTGEDEPKADEAKADKTKVDLALYEGVYERPGFPSRVYVAAEKDGLIVVNLYSDNPGDVIKLKHVEGHDFHRIRDDDKQPGEMFRFEVDNEGRVTRFWQHNQYMTRAQ